MILSVILPTNRVDNRLFTAIESTLLDLPKQSAVIVVLNGTALEHLSNLRGKYKNDSRVKFSISKTPGIVPALNVGILATNSTFIARMDGDDIVVQGRFQAQLDYLKQHPGAGMVGTGVQYLIDNKVSRRTPYVPQNPCESLIEELETPIFHPTVMLKRSVIEQIGLYKSTFEGLEDFELWSRMRKISKLTNLPIVGLTYRIHSNQYSKQKSLRKEILKLAIAIDNLKLKNIALNLTGLEPDDKLLMAVLGSFRELSEKETTLITYWCLARIKQGKMHEKIMLLLAVMRLNKKISSAIFTAKQIFIFAWPRIIHRFI